jgi:hypothetical protein
MHAVATRSSPDHRRGRRASAFTIAVLLFATIGCRDDGSPSAPSPVGGASVATVRFVFLGATARRNDLPASAQECVSGVGVTHMHPSWRSFDAIPLQAVPPDRYQLTLNDVPANTSVSFRVNDQNSCDENPTGAVTRNVLANDVRLIQNATTPGNGDEPGYRMTVTANGTITQ